MHRYWVFVCALGCALYVISAADLTPDVLQYRPSQWRMRRGEARYTAASIHM